MEKMLQFFHIFLSVLCYTGIIKEKEEKTMLDLLVTVLFCWLFFKAIGLAFKVAWGTTKVIASLLFAVAVPMLVICLLFAGGIVLLVPVALIAIAFGLLKAVV